MVGMLPQACRTCQKRRVADPAGLRPERHRDAMIGPAVAIPIAALEKLGEGIEVRPGLWRHGQSRLLRRRAIGLALEGIAAVDQHERRASARQGKSLLAVEADLFTKRRSEV